MMSFLLPISVVAICLMYAIFRYIVFGEVAIEQLPAFVGNKGLSFSSAALLFLSALTLFRSKAEPESSNKVLSQRFGRWAWHCVLLHAILSLALLSPAYYGKFFEQGLLNLKGELIILFGALAVYCFYRLQSLGENLLLKVLCSALLTAHLLPMWGKWFSPQAWYGFMPPISLLSCTLSVAALVFFYLSQKRSA